ncbi:hypothetical protein L3X38_001493 [Prunus dulcis]|uniref:Uncharacterized protein n=1 Tax=Prunus dulcis TaxID=3755 RepID=A0AAD4ZK97_PRUDU|nr:hypothetical protein L3X38_001493 [Prunus dulcis]
MSYTQRVLKESVPLIFQSTKAIPPTTLRSTWWRHHLSPPCHLPDFQLRPLHRPPPPNMVEPPIKVGSLPPLT